MARKTLKFCPYCGSDLELKLADDRQRLVCSGCGEIYYQNPLPAATALVLDSRGRLLLGKRTVEPARGGWCLPGGFIELDESMEEAALRELKEETGLEGRIEGFVGCFYQKSMLYGGVIIFGYQVLAVKGALKAGDDLEDLTYYDLDEMPPLAFESHRRLVDKLKEQLRTPSRGS